MIGSRYDRPSRSALSCRFLVDSGRCCTMSSDSEDEPESLLEEISSITRSGFSEGFDVWQKFLQPLTPPLSPVKCQSTCPLNSYSDKVSERLQLVSDYLDAYSSEKCQSSECEMNLRTKLISDCMWNGQKRERLISNASEIDIFPTPAATPCSSPPPIDCVLPSNSTCVDPIAVFPLAVQAEQPVGSRLSDSEEEEIDVVSVDSQKPPPKLKIKLVRRSPKKRPNKVCQTKYSPYNIQSEYRRKKSPSSRPKSKPHVVAPKQQIILTCSIVQPKPEPLSRIDVTDNSDVDDMETGPKRVSHNVLERKRRIDLKRSFETLRDSIPNLKKAEKTPKVLVLQKAASHISNLQQEEQRCLKMKKQLQAKRQVLIAQLASLINVNSVKLEM